MKKKGLIIATIVMVLVLAVSLTTATYAWFTANAVTKLQEFNVVVKSDNDVNIGFKATYLNTNQNSTPALSGITTSLFRTGSGVTFGSHSTTGDLYAGSWTNGSVGLSANLEHNIKWGQQSKAVAAQFSSDTIESVTASTEDKASIGTVLNGLKWDAAEGAYVTYAHYNNYKIIAAKDGGMSSGESPVPILTQQEYAKANYGTTATDDGDYVYMVLGVSPNKNLTNNQLVIAVDYTNQLGSTIGILSAIHVAYRVTKATDPGNGTWDKTAAVVKDTTTYGANDKGWRDVDIFGNNATYGTPVEGEDSLTSNITTSQTLSAAWSASFGQASAEKTYCMTIDNLSLKQGLIDQIELIIYIDGTDSDCNNSAIDNISGTIRIFFATTPEVQQNP